MAVLRVGSSDIHLLWAVKGLVSEANRVAREIKEVKPEALAVSVSPEELRALEECGGEPAEPSNYEEEVYMEGLSHFGEVKKPPPCFVAALDQCKTLALPIVAIDMDEEAYTDAYVSRVSTLEVIGVSLREKRLRRRRFAAETPEEFVMEFDRIVNRSDGFRRLQEDREAFMAGEIAKMAKLHSRIMAVVDYERGEGIRTALER